MSEYRIKPGKIGEKVIDAYKNVEDKFVETFLNEDGSLKTGGMAEKATAAYKKIEEEVVETYKKVEDGFVETFLEKAENSDQEEKTEEKSADEQENA